jgi:hypothetical protein
MRAHPRSYVFSSCTRLLGASLAAIALSLIAVGSAGAKTVSTGDGFSCAINYAGAVYCSGSNNLGQRKRKRHGFKRAGPRHWHHVGRDRNLIGPELELRDRLGRSEVLGKQLQYSCAGDRPDIRRHRD